MYVPMYVSMYVPTYRRTEVTRCIVSSWNEDARRKKKKKKQDVSVLSVKRSTLCGPTDLLETRWDRYERGDRILLWDTMAHLLHKTELEVHKRPSTQQRHAIDLQGMIGEKKWKRILYESYPFPADVLTRIFLDIEGSRLYREFILLFYVCIFTELRAVTTKKFELPLS